MSKLFFIEILSFSEVTETIGFFPIQILIFRMLRNNADVRRCSYLSLGYLCFPERKCIFLSLEENLWTINRKKEFPDFDNTKDFPWPWKILVFPWRFPNRGNPGSWLVLACQIHWHLNKKCFFSQRLLIIQVQNQYWQLVICIQNLLSHGIHSF